MKILAVDDERMALEILTEAIKSAKSDAQVFPFRNVIEAIDFVNQGNQIDIAFLDINMRELTGVDAANMLKKINPKINIIFATGYDEYMNEAFNMHSSGYITKPITKEKILKEINDLRYPITENLNNDLKEKKCILKVQCFGNFDCFTMNGEPLHFERQKSKELLAYLVYRRGATCTIKELAAIIFEDDYYDKKIQAYIQKIVSSLMKTLKDVNAENVITKQYNSLGIDRDLLDCDYYKTLRGGGREEYLGEFMAQYSWAEDVNWFLMNK